MRKSVPAYIGISKPDPERLKQYDLARVHGGFADRADFFRAACDKLADEILANVSAAEPTPAQHVA